MFNYLEIQSNSLGADESTDEEAYQPLLAIWAIQLAISCGWYKKTSSNQMPSIFRGDDFSKLTGVTIPVERDEDGDAKRYSESYEKVTDAKLLKLCQSRLAGLTHSAVPNDLPLIANVEMIGNAIGFNSTEKKLLVFASALTCIHDFRGVIEKENYKVTTSVFARKVAGLLHVSVNELLEALREDALLSLTGMVEINKSSIDLERKVEVPDRLAELLTLKKSSEADLIKHFLKEASAPSLELSDYPHLKVDIQALTNYLSKALSGKENGVNILFGSSLIVL